MSKLEEEKARKRGNREFQRFLAGCAEIDFDVIMTTPREREEVFHKFFVAGFWSGKADNVSK